MMTRPCNQGCYIFFINSFLAVQMYQTVTFHTHTDLLFIVDIQVPW